MTGGSREFSSKQSYFDGCSSSIPEAQVNLKTYNSDDKISMKLKTVQTLETPDHYSKRLAMLTFQKRFCKTPCLSLNVEAG